MFTAILLNFAGKTTVVNSSSVVWAIIVRSIFPMFVHKLGKNVLGNLKLDVPCLDKVGISEQLQVHFILVLSLMLIAIASLNIRALISNEICSRLLKLCSPVYVINLKVAFSFSTTLFAIESINDFWSIISLTAFISEALEPCNYIPLFLIIRQFIPASHRRVASAASKLVSLEENFQVISRQPAYLDVNLSQSNLSLSFLEHGSRTKDRQALLI